MVAEQIYKGNYSFVIRQDGRDITYVGRVVPRQNESYDGVLYILVFGDDRTAEVEQDQCVETTDPVSATPPPDGFDYRPATPEVIPPVPVLNKTYRRK